MWHESFHNIKDKKEFCAFSTALITQYHNVDFIAFCGWMCALCVRTYVRTYNMHSLDGNDVKLALNVQTNDRNQSNLETYKENSNI